MAYSARDVVCRRGRPNPGGGNTSTGLSSSTFYEVVLVFSNRKETYSKEVNDASVVAERRASISDRRRANCEDRRSARRGGVRSINVAVAR